MLLGFESNVPGIAAVGFVVDRVSHVADEAQRRRSRERIYKNRVRVRKQEHIALMNLLKTADAGTIETDALGKSALLKLPG